MIGNRVRDALQRFERLLDARLTMGAHHAFDLNRFCHYFFLLFCLSGNELPERFRVDRFSFSVV